MAASMHYVYILRSVSKPDQTYVGETSDLTPRFAEHNAGKSRHTARYAPWEPLVTLASGPERKPSRSKAT